MNFKPLNTTYYNMVSGNSFPYYQIENSRGGLMIEMSSDQTVTTRERYNVGSFLNDFGAWTGAIGFIIALILPYLRITTFESFLMKNLYMWIIW